MRIGVVVVEVHYSTLYRCTVVSDKTSWSNSENGFVKQITQLTGYYSGKGDYEHRLSSYCPVFCHVRSSNIKGARELKSNIILKGVKSCN